MTHALEVWGERAPPALTWPEAGAAQLKYGHCRALQPNRERASPANRVAVSRTVEAKKDAHPRAQLGARCRSVRHCSRSVRACFRWGTGRRSRPVRLSPHPPKDRNAGGRKMLDERAPVTALDQHRCCPLPPPAGGAVRQRKPLAIRQPVKRAVRGELPPVGSGEMFPLKCTLKARRAQPVHPDPADESRPSAGGREGHPGRRHIPPVPSAHHFPSSALILRVVRAVLRLTA